MQVKKWKVTIVYVECSVPTDPNPNSTEKSYSLGSVLSSLPMNVADSPLTSSLVPNTSNFFFV